MGSRYDRPRSSPRLVLQASAAILPEVARGVVEEELDAIGSHFCHVFKTGDPISDYTTFVTEYTASRANRTAMTTT